MDMTPKQIVSELDKYIVGQHEAKRAVAIALRNRYRRSKLTEQERDEITPKNIILKGPTGVGKTEIARRLAKLVKAPFVKVEATKYTEVGYVGRDVESMVRDLVEVSLRLVKDEKVKEVKDKAYTIAVDRVAEALMKNKSSLPENIAKQDLKDEIVAHNLDHMIIELDVADAPKSLDIGAGNGQEINIGSIFGDYLPKKTKKRKVCVQQALEIILDEESNKLIDDENLNAEAIRRAENDGIIFIDEIDKIASSGKGDGGPDVSREGVQRDILPIVEGCTVNTKYGNIRTDYVLFIASGAFHVSKVQDLIPELQGRFPVLVELNSLTKEDFVRILTEPQNSITSQYIKLLSVDNIELQFTIDGIDEIANTAVDLNNTLEDIGARRLHTVMEHIVEEVSFEYADEEKNIVVINSQFVLAHLNKQSKSLNLKKYIL